MLIHGGDTFVNFYANCGQMVDIHSSFVIQHLRIPHNGGICVPQSCLCSSIKDGAY